MRMRARLRLSAAIATILIVTAFLSFRPAAYGQPEKESKYVNWGVDEYELFGLTRSELSRKFKGRLFFDKDHAVARLCETGTGLGYAGPTFRLKFSNGTVSSVQGVFEGCTANYFRPPFDSKEAAINYAVEGLKASGASAQIKLEEAKRELAKEKAPASGKTKEISKESDSKAR